MVVMWAERGERQAVRTCSRCCGHWAGDLFWEAVEAYPLLLARAPTARTHRYRAACVERPDAENVLPAPPSDEDRRAFMSHPRRPDPPYIQAYRGSNAR